MNFNENTFIFVFGSAGFIGREVIQILSNRSIPFYGIDIQDADLIADLSTLDLSVLLRHVKKDARVGIINCAGYNQKVENLASNQQPKWFDLDRWQQCMDMNLTFPLKLAKFAEMCVIEGSALVDVIYIGSLYSENSPNNVIYQGQVGMQFKEPEYVASKHGLIGLVKALSALKLGENIRFNAISPGAVQSVKMNSLFIQKFKHVMGGQTNNVEEIAILIVEFLFKNWSLFQGANIKAFGGALN